MSIEYLVTTEEFAEKHYLKNFRKRYKNSFDIHWNTYVFMLQKFDLILKKEGTTLISCISDDIVIYKLEFKMSPKESAKKSGNRCVVAQYRSANSIKILLVYCKNDIQGSSETSWWKNLIKNNYSVYKSIS